MFQDLFPVLRPITVALFIDVEETDRIVRAKLVNQYLKPLLLDLV